jgi:hypothetical protein
MFLLLACATEWTTLEPYPNPFEADEPVREKPLEVLVVGDTAVVSLQGSVDEPGNEVALVDLTDGSVRRVEVGSSPTGLALHPDGHVVVFNRFSNWASLVDIDAGREVERWPMDFYAIEGAYDRDGELWVSNRWRDSVQVRGGEVPVGVNPRDVAVGEDVVAVAALTGGTVTLVDRRLQQATHTVDLGAPANGLALVGDWLVVATMSASTHHLPFDGPDTDGDGQPGDGTPNVNFQDLQNELAVIDTRTGEVAWRYTSDTACCFDYRDVDPVDEERHGDLLDPSLWIVGGALPEQVVTDGEDVWVSYSASNQVQRFAVDPQTGALSPSDPWDTVGHNPHGLAMWGDRVVVAHRLSETLGVYEADGTLVREIEVGELSAGGFPSTDAEIGELVNNVTATFSVDGDLSCVHCHREGDNIDKAFSMPLTRYGGVGLRMTMAYRGSADTRPWFFETAMDESNFKPVLNEFARIENFCCSDYTLWPDGAPAGCSNEPECDQPNTGSADGFDAMRGRHPEHPRPTGYATRDAFFLAAAEALMGRQQSFGDGLFFEDPVTLEKSAIALDFDGITRALGRFLLVAPRLFPNPNVENASSARGRALFESPTTGCSACHPAPAFTLSHENNPQNLPLRMSPVVTPNRAADGTNLDLLADGFVEIFPQAEVETCDEVCGVVACDEDPMVCDDVRDVYLGVPSLRGIWDRAPSMLHDGRAQGLREVLCTPGHPALHEGETGFNERDGVVDSHGGTSHLTPSQIDDLVAYLETL